jgi:predicted SprT family Zn-dependent metalloprotease
MKLTFIRYGRRKIKVGYRLLDDCLGLYDPNLQTLHIDKRLKDLKLFNTLMHELFHIIMYNEGINVNDKGEESIAIAVGDGYEKIFKANPFLVRLLTKCLKKVK